MLKQRSYLLDVSGREVLYFVSSKCRTWRPAKSLLVFAPDEIAKDTDRLRRFAAESGWEEKSEKDGDVLILPVTEKGWKNEDPAIVKQIYKAVWRDAPSPDPNDFRGTVWCWETLLFGAGYSEGAVLVGNAAVAHPNAFACAAMVNGMPSSYEAGEDQTDRWLLPDASFAWNKKNREIPVEVLMLGDQDYTEAEKYFLSTACSREQVVVNNSSFDEGRETTELLMDHFSTRIRWKNSPDGTATRCLNEKQFMESGEFEHDFVDSNGFRYDFHIKVPKGVSDTKGLAAVILLHGHGEPAWLFSYKNGWAEMADETGEFILVLPNSPENSWKVERDEEIFQPIIQKLSERYGIDTERVYLTGFSNGSLATCWYGERHPELFAAISPWNSPMVCYEDDLERSGYELPIFAINGDLDHKMDVPRRFYREIFSTFIRLNGGEPKECGEGPVKLVPDEVWTSGNRYNSAELYPEGDRLTTYVFHDKDGNIKVCYTNISEMPHGAIKDEARATWQVIRRFRRPGRGMSVVTE